MIDFSAPPTHHNQAKSLSEFTRILNLPMTEEVTEAQVDEISKLFLLPGAYSSGARLLHDQATAFLQFAMSMVTKTPGIFAPMGVGCGKTLTTLAVASMSYAPGAFAATRSCKPIAKRVLLLIPPALRDQLLRDIKWARTMIPLPLEVFDLTSSRRRDYAHARKDGLYISTYSRMSAADAEEITAMVDPDIIIADEAHNIANPLAARTMRFIRCLKQRTRAFVPLSGTITQKSIRDYSHLMKFALGSRSPIPLDDLEVMWWDWSIAPAPDERQPPRVMEPLFKWGERVGVARVKRTVEEDGRVSVRTLSDNEFLRESYAKRLRTAPGVVQSSDRSIGTSLYYDREAIETPSVIEDALKALDETWTAPNGDELDQPLLKFKWASELAAGYYNDLLWPDKPNVDRSKELHAARQMYHSELRKWISRTGRQGLDTPFLVGSHFYKNGGSLAPDLYSLWKDKHVMEKSAEAEKWPERYANPVRLSSFKVDTAAEIAMQWPKTEGGILWVYHQEVGVWLVEVLRKLTDRRVIYAPSGTHEIEDPANSKALFVASISSHGVGKNLQAFRNNLFVEGFHNAQLAEQSVGRTHRPGQQADELTMQILMGSSHDSLRLAAVLNAGLYIHTTISKQKLFQGRFLFRPEIFGSAYLRQVGALNTEGLSAEQEQRLQEHFS